MLSSFAPPPPFALVSSLTSLRFAKFPSYKKSFFSIFMISFRISHLIIEFKLFCREREWLQTNFHTPHEKRKRERGESGKKENWDVWFSHDCIRGNQKSVWFSPNFRYKVVSPLSLCLHDSCFFPPTLFFSLFTFIVFHIRFFVLFLWVRMCVARMCLCALKTFK